MSVVTILVFVAFLAIGGLIFFRFLRERFQRWRNEIKRQARAEMLLEMIEAEDTQELPVRYSSPLDPITATLEHRIIKRNVAKDHYPFALPGLEPMTPLPDVMKLPARVSKVVMRANDWVEARDQYGFVMPEYSGLWKNVGLKIIDVYDGEWIVPKEKTGYHNITRFKKVRPQDFKIPPIIHPRDLPECSPPREMSPLA